MESDSGNDENSTSKGKGRMFTGYDSRGVGYSRLGGSQSENADPFYASPPSGSGGAAAAEPPNMTTGMTLPPPPLPKKDSKFAKVPVSLTRRPISDIEKENTHSHILRAAASKKPTPHRCVFRKLLARLSHLTMKTTMMVSRVSSSILPQLSPLGDTLEGGT